jgi:hypothetical protein
LCFDARLCFTGLFFHLTGLAGWVNLTNIGACSVTLT